MGKKSELTVEQRTQLVLRLLSKEEPAAQIARRAGISEQTLYRWRDEFLRGGAAGLSGRGGSDVQAKEIGKLQEQLAERDQVIGEDYGRQSDFKKTLGPVELSEELRVMVREGLEADVEGSVRLKQLLCWLGVARSSWYGRRSGEEPRRPPGRKPKVIDPALAAAIEALAQRYPWWGYKRIAIIARREGLGVTNKQVYRVFKAARLLQKPRVREAAIYQTARLFELLPSGPNELWQADVTYLHIPGHGWWYAVTVIDYYSRYLLACHFHGQLQRPPDRRSARCSACRSRAAARAARENTVPGDRQRLELLARHFQAHIAGRYAHVRIQYRTPTQLGLLEDFTRPSRPKRCTGSSIPVPPRRANRWSSSAVATTGSARTGRSSPWGAVTW